MKISIKFDESAGLTPNEVVIEQKAALARRERNRQWLEAQRGQSSSRGNLSVNLGTLVEMAMNGGGK